MKKEILYAAVVAAFAFAGNPARATTYSAVGDFTTTDGNPNGE
jgi:hypothetical protein